MVRIVKFDPKLPTLAGNTARQKHVSKKPSNAELLEMMARTVKSHDDTELLAGLAIAGVPFKPQPKATAKTCLFLLNAKGIFNRKTYAAILFLYQEFGEDAARLYMSQFLNVE